MFRTRREIAAQVGSILIVLGIVSCAGLKVIAGNEAAFAQWIDDQGRGFQKVRQGIGTLVASAEDTDSRVKRVVVQTLEPGTLAAAAQLTAGYLAASPFLFQANVVPPRDQIEVTAAALEKNGQATTVAKAGHEQCRLRLQPTKGADKIGAGWAILDARCSRTE
ncbi:MULTISPECIES: hypothetical protein [Ralstonia]|jgi:hypothetical protein|uniref:Uncharacterized protein n=2 Tax=Ralstonia pickettii TaxID=329 RepID=R0DWD1_RALPI|nr:hypothetical protein [Ralstonia pickettii]ENZ77723.1 hypothetical protein OR214_01999 [Ralstonia pickettii OR214]MCM3583876.1 hypothetical protein [Ralstonia pickettii]